MAVNPKTTVRKNVALPLELAAQIERFRTSRGLSSESDALRRLVEIGLGSIDTSKDLSKRCHDATESGNNISYIISNILEDHPLVTRISISPELLEVYMRDDTYLRFDKMMRTWRFNDDPDIPF